jgi:hypothetical protein
MRVLDGAVREQLGGRVSLAWKVSGPVFGTEVLVEPKWQLADVATTPGAS